MTPADYNAYTGETTPQQGALTTAVGIDATLLLVATAPDFGCVQWEPLQ
jgi:hypothetical protein